MIPPYVWPLLASVALAELMIRRRIERRTRWEATAFALLALSAVLYALH